MGYRIFDHTADLGVEVTGASLWEIPPTGGMGGPGLLYTSEKRMKGMGADEGPRQVANVAHLPGIVKASLALPDMHWG